MRIDKIIEKHDNEIGDFRKNLGQFAIDLNIVMVQYQYLRESNAKIQSHYDNFKEGNGVLEQRLKMLSLKVDDLGNKISKRDSIKDIFKRNSARIVMVAIPFVGIVSTLLYEIGRYLRNLPVH